MKRSLRLLITFTSLRYGLGLKLKGKVENALFNIFLLVLKVRNIELLIEIFYTNSSLGLRARCLKNSKMWFTKFTRLADYVTKTNKGGKYNVLKSLYLL